MLLNCCSTQKGLFNLTFNPIELSHKNQIEPFLLEESPLLSGYTFASLMMWKAVYQYEWTLLNDRTLILSVNIPNQSVRHLLQPIGSFSKESQSILLNKIAKLDYQITIYNVSSRFIEQYPEFISHFEIKNDLGFANYIYKADDLALLPGRKYIKKRNLISQAEKSYQWVASTMKGGCLPQCIKLLEQISYDDRIEQDQSLMNEKQALDFTLSHFNELNQKGVFIKVNNRPVAFSIYEELNPDTVDVHFEKADRNYKGLYQLINRETSKIIHESGYKFINREEDLNLPGLRKAKESYNPVEVRPAYQLVFKR